MKRLLVLLVVLAGISACGYDDTVVPRPDDAATTSTSPPTTTPCDNDGTQLRSYAPDSGPVGGDAVQAIKARGRLVAGVAADALLLGARNPARNRIEGFDIDMVYAIAGEIFGETDRAALDRANRVELKVITAAQRIPFLQDGTVDIVARNFTVTCTRWQDIAFSEVYYQAGQKLLVGLDSGIDGVDDLADERICAPAGTTTVDNLADVAPDATIVTAPNISACMILFQNGDADGVSSDDTVLAGLAAQDPYAEVLDTAPLSKEPYGIGVGQDNVDLVRLVNQVLEDMRRDGRWRASYDTWLKPELKVSGVQPEPVYGR
ncbi:glutamate ABC transporter substrate-binding protein [Nocardioides plantarum]|uniref:Glutamate ABC transporter substrate-binding protein n=1 Tax=Nocardioides plantarum TaxID=29299 RepID=A0ABV5KBQ3_9ACTN|nr:glutamate ABC transporter substrate-binding protein [Nocardioides plantarum]